mgnify:CR=1 FL=1
MPVPTQRVAEDIEPPAPDFPVHVRAYAELAHIVREEGLLKRAGWFYLLVGIGQVVLLAGIVAGFLMLGDSWFQLLIAGALGVFMTQVALLAHEAAHRQIFAGKRANTVLARITGNGVVGISYSWWNSKHTRHHSNPNQVGLDPDISSKVVAFVPEDAARSRGLFRVIIRHQGWLLLPLLTLEGVNLHAQSVRHVAWGRGVERRWTEIALLVARFALLLIPVFVMLPLGLAFAFLGVQLAVFGVYMGAVFAPNHKGMVVFERDSAIDFFSRQVRGSRNIRGGWWMTGLMGGLNYQIEHHLFPGMARPNLSKVRPLVIEHCRRFDVPYTEVGLLRSYAIVVAYLNRVGISARDPWECPLMVDRFRG